MRSLLIIVLPPIFDDDAGFFQRVKDLAVEQLVAQSVIEAIDERIPHRLAGCIARSDIILLA